ncbi:uncharacterized protein LOC142230653 [Haematobia irritans]|uniref:uncharacterized protein LOC142230653 n=1 Tax=Haematobia irritans TaxID=7368 RepID=UPI003F508E81
MAASEDQLEILLEKWNVLHLLPTLKDENITIDVLQIINRKHLEELTRRFKLGDKIVFEFNINKWREETGKPIHDEYYLDVANISTSSRKSSCSSITFSQEPLTERFDSNTGVKLSTILNHNKTGKRILETYKKYEHINEDQRNLIITTIASYFHANELHMSLQESYNLEKQIIEMFPNEKLHSYRTDRRGKLYVKYNNMKRNQIYQKDRDDVNLHKGSKPVDNIVSEENAKEIIHSLKYDNFDQEQFLKMWQSCANYRIRQIFDEHDSLKDIFKAWPQYKECLGAKLINMDFGVLYKDYTPIFEWETKLISVYNVIKKEKYIKDAGIKSVFDKIDLSNAASNMSLFMMRLIWCLHGYLYPTAKYVRRDKDGKKTYGKYTIKDSQESSIFLAESFQEVDNHLNFLEKRNENIQPFIFVVGDVNLEDSEYNYYVYLDHAMLHFADFQRALDTCFKSFFIFNLEFPGASNQFWIFVQEYFYDMKSAHTNKFSKILNILNELNYSKNE